jgi:cation:H+ antiporter
MLQRYRGFLLVTIAALPAVSVRITQMELPAVMQLAVFGAAVVAASFLLAWTAEAAQRDISGGLAIALLAFIAVLPEYAVDLYFAFRAGSDPTYAAYAAANMTGSNRLLLGLGWPVVVLLGLMVAKRTGNPVRAITLEPGTRMELGFLLVAGVVAFIAPVTGVISLPLAIALIAWFCFYLVRVSRQEVHEPNLIGTAAVIGALPDRRRRMLVPLLFLIAAGLILLCAEPFAESLVSTGEVAGIDEFLLVQWLAPLASEAPEFIIAILFALRGNAQDGIATLISSKVNQWTLLVGTLPIAYWIGGGGPGGLRLDPRQVEEMLLTATQTLMGVAILLTLRFPRWGAWALIALFLVQFPLTSTSQRLVLAALYAVIAIALGIRHYRLLLPTLIAAFRSPTPTSH